MFRHQMHYMNKQNMVEIARMVLDDHELQEAELRQWFQAHVRHATNCSNFVLNKVACQREYASCPTFDELNI